MSDPTPPTTAAATAAGPRADAKLRQGALIPANVDVGPALLMVMLAMSFLACCAKIAL